MPETGKTYEADIIDTTVMGAGVARIDGAAVFVRGCAAGDRCTVLINEKKKNYFSGEAVEFSSLSDKRCDDGCEYYGRCGGCSLRHVMYEHEGRIKERAVRTALEKAGVKDFKLNPIRMPSPERYRNKAVFHLDGRGGAGYFAEGTRNVVPLGESGCSIVPEEFCRIARYSAKLIKCAAGSVTVRSSTDGKLAVTFEIDGAGTVGTRTAEELMASFPSVSGVFTRENGRRELTLLCGEKHTVSEICSLRYLVSPDAFFQVNYEGAAALFSEIGRFAGDGRLERIYDLFCGTGAIGIFLASRHPDAKVTGIEINKCAVENAKMNAALNLVGNAVFRCGDASEYAAICGGGAAGLTVIDPPRAGCSEKTIAALLGVMPERIIYVSCNPFTLARDVKRLEDGGYVLTEATPVNMFPRSEHVETVCLLSKLNVKQHIEVELTMDEMDLTAAEKKASYEEIKAYVLEKFGMKVSHLYIAQVKRKCGIIERENYNKPKSEDARQPQCPPEKEVAIRAALEHFGMI